MSCAIGNFVESDGVTISNATEVATLPATNLLLPRVSDVWFSGSTSGSVDFDFGAGGAIPVTMVALLYHNANPTGQINFTAAGTQGALPPGTAPFETGNISQANAGSTPYTKYKAWGRGHTVVYFDGAVSRRWWRMTFNYFGGALSASRIYIGSPWEPSRGIDYGDTVRTVDDSQERIARSGARHVLPLGRRRQVDFTLSGVGRQELLDEAGYLERIARTSEPILWTRDPDATSIGAPTAGDGTVTEMFQDLNVREHTVYGAFAEMGAVVQSKAERIHRKSFRIIEEIHP